MDINIYKFEQGIPIKNMGTELESGTVYSLCVWNIIAKREVQVMDDLDMLYTEEQKKLYNRYFLVYFKNGYSYADKLLPK